MSVVIFMNVIMKHLSCMLFFVKELCIIISKRMYYCAVGLAMRPINRMLPVAFS